MSERATQVGGFTGVLHGGLGGAFMQFPHVPADADAIREQGAKAAIYGMPWDATSISRSGASYGPRGIREVSCQFLTYNATIDFDLAEALHPVDCGDCSIVLANAEKTFANAERDIDQMLAAGAVPVLLGGDHSITIPAIRCVARAYENPGLVVIDTHMDSSPDVGGELLNHCTEVARAVDAGVDPERIVLVGHNGWANPHAEIDYCKEHGIRVIWLEDVWERGAEMVGDEVAAAMDGADGVYLSVDMDGLDAAHAVGVSMPTPGGLTTREALTLVRRIAACGLLGYDVVETAPSLDPTAATAILAGRITLDALAAHAGASWTTRVSTVGGGARA